MSLGYDGDTRTFDEPDKSFLNSAGRDKALGGAAKRAFDVVGATLALLFLAPLLVMLFALVKSFDRGPAIYAHRRVGQGGRAFMCLKFRTMRGDSDEALRRLIERDSEAAREWAETRKLKRDPRVTPIGEVLRKTSLDELPQLLNILRGEMSFVGPRPVVLAEMDHYGQNRVFYLCARPGLTGLWQVSGRNDVSYQRRVEFDRQYAETWSFWNDARIVVRTIPAILKAEGVY